MINVEYVGSIIIVKNLFACCSRTTFVMDIVCCGHINLEGYDGEASAVVEQCALECVGECAKVEVYDNPLSLIEERCGSRSTSLVDLLVCSADLPGMDGIGLVHDLREYGSRASVVLVTDDRDDALEAINLQVDAFLIASVSYTDFRDSLLRVFRELKKKCDDSLELNAREGMVRIRKSRFLYSETTDHYQVAHLADGSSCSVRMSSQVFFKLFDGDPRFFKVGSSYIVNVQKIRLVDARESTATMMDGSVISVPVRVRKSLEEAILGDG